MSIRTKNVIYSLVLILAIGLVWLYRQPRMTATLKLEGATMGTTYHITYFDEKERNFQQSVDSLLLLVNKSINTYDSTSEISQFNNAVRVHVFKLPYFLPPLKKFYDKLLLHFQVQYSIIFFLTCL